jgi:hypothetical protein
MIVGVRTAFKVINATGGHELKDDSKVLIQRCSTGVQRCMSVDVRKGGEIKLSVARSVPLEVIHHPPSSSPLFSNPSRLPDQVQSQCALGS